MSPPATKGSVFTAGALSTASSLAFTAKASIPSGKCPFRTAGLSSCRLGLTTKAARVGFENGH